MSDWGPLILGIAASYLLGSIPTSYWVGRLGRGLDLREHGSKNLGTTNMFRVLGWRYALPVGLMDMFKGALPAFAFRDWFGGPAWSPVLYGAAAVVGHVFSVFVSFRGGKGVATAAGVFLAMAPVAFLISFGLWVGIVLVTGYVSVGSLVAAVLFPLWVWLTTPGPRHEFWLSVGLAAFVVFTHRSNLRRLRRGTESRFGRRRAA